MRRNDRLIEDREELQRIMDACHVCCVAFSGEPYVIPMNFGAQWTEEGVILYFHGAGEGTKLERMRADSRVAFCMYAEGELLLKTPACGSTMRYASICGEGRLEEVSDTDEKVRGLTCIMRQYDKGEKAFEFGQEMVKRTAVLRLRAEHLTGKSNIPREKRESESEA